jgi:predicted phage terminase large subunit-like protein
LSTNEKALTLIQWELDKRRVEEHGFEAFCNVFGYELARHHKLLAQKLEKTITTPGHNLIVCMPPGHAKSTYASVLFPSYYIGRFHKKSIVMASHTAQFAARWGRACRRLIDDPKYQYIFGVNLSKDSKSADRFDLSNGSEYFACGVGGAVTGQRSDLAIIDDPVRGKEDAESETIQDNIWEWYKNDLMTRSKPGSNKIIIMTRWHEFDLVGRILLSTQREKWDVLSLPALAEADDPLGREFGEPLWPEYITREFMEEFMEDKRSWNCLWQQRPTGEEGNYFKAEWIKVVETHPKNLKIYGASDYAVTADKGDYTVHVVIGHDEYKDEIYILDVWRAQEETNVWVDKFIDLCLKHEPLMWAEETGQIIKSLNPFIEKEMVRRRCYTYREQFTSSHEKSIRAQSFKGYMANGRVKILNRDWTDNLILELLKFPYGRHDDQVDSLGLIGRMLNEMVNRSRERKQKATFEYKSNVLGLPGLNEKISSSREGEFRKI